MIKIWLLFTRKVGKDVSKESLVQSLNKDVTKYAVTTLKGERGSCI